MEPAYSTTEVDQKAKSIAEGVSERLTLGGVPSTVTVAHYGFYEVNYKSAALDAMKTCFSIQEEFENRKQNGKLIFKFSGVYLQKQDLRAVTLKEKGETLKQVVERLSQKVLERYQAESLSVSKQNEKLRQRGTMYTAIRELKEGNPEYAECLHLSTDPQKLELTVELTVEKMGALLEALKAAGINLPKDDG
jgi:hypothetical protein